ncbi:MAG: hypothetical protein ACI4HI_17815 [Lachnospiraceae bacterium]
MNKKNILRWLCGGLILCGVFVVGIISCQLRLDNEHRDELEQYNGKIQCEEILTDQYDSETSSFSDFYTKKGACDMAKKAYDRLLSEPNIDYYEYSDMPFYYVGEYNKKDCAEHQFINENNHTDCLGMWVDEKFCRDYHLNTQLDTGRTFQSHEYQADTKKPVPLLLGNHYKGAFRLGEKFKGEYVWEDFDCYVVGFLKKGASISLGGEKTVLDDYVVLPTLSVEHIEDEHTKAVHLSVHLEGFFYYKNADAYNTAATVINQIADETGFQYTHLKTLDDLNVLSEEKRKILQIIRNIALGITIFVFLLQRMIRRKK